MILFSISLNSSNSRLFSDAFSSNIFPSKQISSFRRTLSNPTTTPCALSQHPLTFKSDKIYPLMTGNGALTQRRRRSCGCTFS